MRLESELDNLGIKYTSEVVGESKVVKTQSGVRVHIYKDHITISDRATFQSFPPSVDSLNRVLRIIKRNEQNK